MPVDPAEVTTLRELEERLMKPEVRASVDELSMLLADEFIEFGSSGRIFDKPQIIAALQGETGSCRRTIDNFQAKAIADGVVLVTYRVTRHGDSPAASVEILRSSIWRQIDGRWQMLFHQGTVVRVP